MLISRFIFYCRHNVYFDSKPELQYFKHIASPFQIGLLVRYYTKYGYRKWCVAQIESIHFSVCYPVFHIIAFCLSDNFVCFTYTEINFSFNSAHWLLSELSFLKYIKNREIKSKNSMFNGLENEATFRDVRVCTRAWKVQDNLHMVI